MSEEQRVRFINKAEELGFQNQGSRLAILRFKNGLQIGDDYLLELSIKTINELHDLELPLTNLKFEVNSTNIELFFDYLKNQSPDKSGLFFCLFFYLKLYFMPNKTLPFGMGTLPVST
jgi:hypothetical protein